MGNCFRWHFLFFMVIFYMLSSLEIYGQCNLEIFADTGHVSCNGACDGHIEIFVLGGTPPYSYQWSNGDTTKRIDNLCAGEYEVYINDANYCDTILLFPIEQPDSLKILISKIINVNCHDNHGMIMAEAIGGSSPYWYNINNQTSWQKDLGIFTDLEAEVYLVKAKDNKGCMDSIIVTVTEIEPIELILDSIKHVTCFNGNDGFIKIDIKGGTPPYCFYWSEDSSKVLENLSAGEKKLIAEDSEGCNDTLIVPVCQPDTFYVEIITEANQYTIIHNDSIKLSAKYNNTYNPVYFNWTPLYALSCYDCPKPYASPMSDTCYVVEITDMNGCMAYDTVCLTVFPKDILIPNAFTPNYDGINDEFKPVGYNNYDQYLMQIYNRQGEMIFKSSDPEIGWDGSYKGRICPAGVYIYVINYKTFNKDGNEIENNKMGSVNILR